MINVKYEEARGLIEEGDILLFRGEGIPAWFIKKAGEGKYTHVGLASWHRENLEIVEFREGNPLSLLFGGNAGQGRTLNLSSQVKKYSGLIDVYRPSSYHQIYEYNIHTKDVESTIKQFDGYAVTDELRDMTGIPYGWKTIFNFLKYNAFGLRLIFNSRGKFLDDDYVSQDFPVCSTAIAICFNKHYTDLIPNRSDVATEPSDIARSSLLSYVFTLDWD